MNAAPAPAGAGGAGARRLAGLVLPYVALVALHLLSGLEMRQPLILADELGYLGNARYLAGAAHLPDMQGSQFYHFGYSLFLLPAFWLFGEPTAIYRAVVVINSLLVGALYFPLSFILTSFAGVKATPARWIAFACCLYPSLVLYSNFAWSENAFTLFFALAAALFGRFLRSKSSRDMLLFGLVAGFLYTIHPRALPVLAAILLYLLLLAVLRVVPVGRLLPGAGAMAAVFLATRAVNQHLKELAWGGGGEVSATKLAARLVPGADFPALIERALGQLLYLSVASHGLFLLGLVAMSWLLYSGLASGSPRWALGQPRVGVPLFILVGAAGIFVAASTLKLYSLHGERAVRGADFIHGRYNEALAVLAIAFALGELAGSGLAKRVLARRVLVAALVILALTAVVMAEVNDALERQVAGRSGVPAREIVRPSSVDAVAVPGVYPLVGLVEGLRLFPISALAIAALVLLVVTTRLSPRAGVVALTLLFGLFSYYNHRHYVLWRMAIAEPRLDLAEEVRRLGPFSAISYDSALPEPGFVAGLQFLLQDAVFERFDSRAGEEPGTEAVIAASDWRQADQLEARFVLASDRGSAFWLLPGEARSRLPTFSYLGQNLGAEPRPGVRETGFYRTEIFDGAPGRWTNGEATLTLPLDPENPPRALEVEVIAPAGRGTRLQLFANGVRLWNRQIPPGPWSNRMGLGRVTLGDRLLIVLRSDTFRPALSDPSSKDRRRLGIVVKSIRLEGRQRPRPKTRPDTPRAKPSPQVSR